MIHPRCFEQDWIREQAQALRARDVQTLEKNILAFELAGRLRRAGLEFIFKGGTSLALFFDDVPRLSIDVDILCLDPADRLKEILGSTMRDRPPFIGSEHQVHRDREAPPTTHFKISYTSSIHPNLNPAPSIQLDVISGESPYTRTEARTVQAPFIEIEEEVPLIVPTASCLLADKIACFSPTTIGYPYQPVITRTGEPAEPRPMKVVKHLFDVGELATVANNLQEAISTYRNVHAEQIKFRSGTWTLDQTLDDTQEAAFWVCRGHLKPKLDHEHIAFFQNGIRALDSHLFNRPFQRAEARLAAARAALAAELIRLETTDFDLSGFAAVEPDLDQLRHAELSGEQAELNRLKQTDLKAFEYWIRMQTLR